MDDRKLEYFRNLLLARQREVEQSIKDLREETDDKPADTETSRGYPFHMADRGTESMEQEKDYLFLSREENHLKEVEEALDAIERGEYGICVVCGKEISLERLEAVPTTRLCKDDAKSGKD